MVVGRLWSAELKRTGATLAQHLRAGRSQGQEPLGHSEGRRTRNRRRSRCNYLVRMDESA